MPGAALDAAVVLALGLMLGLMFGPTLAAQAAPSVAPLVDDAGSAIGPGWRVVGLPQQKPPLTTFSAAHIDGRAALSVKVQASYGNLLHMLPALPAPKRLSWSWRVDQPNPQADLSQRAGDDSAVRVCMSFDLPLERVPFVDRQRLVIARQLSGEPLPAATLCWVWASRESAGSVVENVYSRRVRYLVLRGAGDVVGRWADESRDIAADFARAFGDESATLPTATAVIVGGDADNTGGSSLAHVAALRIDQ